MPFESLAYSIFALIYPTALLLPLMLTNNLGDISLFALVLTFIISPVADVFAYLVGMTFKGKKLCMGNLYSKRKLSYIRKWL